MKQSDFNWSAFIEANRFWIGCILLVLVMASGGLLLYTENRNRQGVNDKLSMLENRIAEMEVLVDTVKDGNTTEEASSAVPTQVVSAVPTSEPKVAGAATSTKSVETSGPVNINTATAEQLDALPGIGPTYAKRIIEYRESHGGFKSTDEMKNVQGIGEKTFEKFKDKITTQ